jgi:uncharacterized RDD family membrane protein YckC
MNRPEDQPGSQWQQTSQPDERSGPQRQGTEQGQSWMPGSPDGQRSQYGSPGQAEPGGPWRGGPDPGWGSVGGPASPVNELDTRVTGRRVIQYIIDYLITGIIASVILWAFDHGRGAGNTVLVAIGAIIDAAWYFWYWVYRPYRANGQSFGMQLLGLRVISKDGGRASMVQLLVRGVLLIVDTFLWGLVGLVTIVCSRYRQRVGDHAARTVVIRAEAVPMQASRDYAGAGQAGYR